MARLALGMAVGWIAATGAAFGQDAGGRTFRMGFTPFPHDLSLEALLWVDGFLSREADIVACHFEGVPWTEALSGEPFHPKLLDDWARTRAAVPDGGRLYLALTPIALTRDGVALYRGSEEGLPIPESLTGKAFDDPLLMGAYLAYVRRAVEYFQPDYLAIGIEADLLRHLTPEKWAPYTRLHKRVYEALKAEHPDLPVFASFTLHGMRNPEWADANEVLAGWRDLDAYNDLIAVSTYPFMAGRTERVTDDLRWLEQEFGALGKPYAIAEMGQPAEPLLLEGMGATMPADAETQRGVLEAYLTFLSTHDSEFLIWFVPRDYDRLWEKMAPSAPAWAKAWKDCGLVSEDGAERPALALWREWMAR